MRRFCTHFLVGGAALLLLACSVGCRANPDAESTFAVPSFSRVPDQWEPEITEAADRVDEELELGL